MNVMAFSVWQRDYTHVIAPLFVLAVLLYLVTGACLLAGGSVLNQSTEVLHGSRTPGT